MPASTADTEWPSPNFPENVKSLIGHFFELVESKDEDVGHRLATEVFTPDGFTQSGIQRFSGSKGQSYCLHYRLLRSFVVSHNKIHTILL
jgi:hypothetical protein